VFNDRVVFLPIGAKATMGDVARALRDVAPCRYGDPIAIDVTMGGMLKLPTSPVAIRNVANRGRTLNS